MGESVGPDSRHQYFAHAPAYVDLRISGFYLCARSYDHLGMALAWRSGGTVEVTGQSKSIEVDSFYSNLRHRHVQMRCNFYPTAEVKGIRSIM